AALWIGLCEANLEARLLGEQLHGWLLGGAPRAAYDPLTALAGRPLALAGFLAVRFFGLVVVVAVIEEFFLRGFLARFVVEGDWWNVPLGTASGAAAAAVVVYAGLSHPAELLAAAAWFSLGTWLLTRTKNIWDCVAMHATTNLLLGAYVLATGSWRLW
ncbi:MAG: CAAX prenyl protease-related protein, partial [Planctomycetales bacterium]|nr:CAAX prenyl protease-related protein [Planctomycetales bacterium]